MRVTPTVVDEEHEWLRDRAAVVVPFVNTVREDLGDAFDETLPPVTEAEYRRTVDAVFTDGDLAVNVAALVRLLRDIDVMGDYPGFVVDELLGRELAAMVAGRQPLRLLGEATFHYADIKSTGGDGATAGADDLDAALAAGVQTRLPGWGWAEDGSPFAP